MIKKYLILIFLLAILIVMAGCDNEIQGQAFKKIAPEEETTYTPINKNDRLVMSIPPTIEEKNMLEPEMNIEQQENEENTNFKRTEETKWSREFAGSPGMWSPGPFNFVVDDLNNDGYFETIFAASGVRQKVYVLDKNGNDFPGFPIELPTAHPIGIAGGNLPYLAVGDIDNDGYKDIVVINHLNDNKLYVFNHFGENIDGFPIDLPKYDDWLPVYQGAVALEDITGDDKLEIIVHESLLAFLVVYDSEGNMLPGWPVQFYNNLGFLGKHQMPSVGNLDSDDDLEIILAKNNADDTSYSSTILAFNPDGTFVSGWGFTRDSMFFNPLALGDFDGDDSLDVLVAYPSTDGLYAYEKNGVLKSGWPVLSGTSFGDSPILTNLNQDEEVEIFISKSGLSYLLDSDGTVSASWAKESSGGWVPESFTSAVSIQNADGITYFFDLSGTNIYGWNENGELVDGFPKAIPGTTFYFSLAVEDIDNDGYYDLITGFEDVPYGSIAWVFVWETGISTGSEEWPMYQNNAKRRGRYDVPPVCIDSVRTTCGEIFPPDCDSLGQTVCCGDDEPEIFVFKQCHEDLYPAVNCEDDESLNVCCDNSGYMVNPENGYEAVGCTDGNTCFAPTELHDVDNDGHTEDCWWDSWYDPDDNPDHCYIFGGCEEADVWAGPENNCPENTKRFFVQEGESGDSAVFGEYGNGNMDECEGKSTDSRCLPYNCDSRIQDCYECCGDDEGEFLISGSGYTRCCNHPNDYIDSNGNCQPKGKTKPVSEVPDP